MQSGPAVAGILTFRPPSPRLAQRGDRAGLHQAATSHGETSTHEKTFSRSSCVRMADRRKHRRLEDDRWGILRSVCTRGPGRPGLFVAHLALTNRVMTKPKSRSQSMHRDLAIWALLAAAYCAFPDAVEDVMKLAFGLLWLLSDGLVLVIVLLYFTDFGRPKQPQACEKASRKPGESVSRGAGTESRPPRS